VKISTAHYHRKSL